MSRLGKLPVEVPAGVKVALNNSLLTVEGPKGKLDFTIPNGISLNIEEKQLTAERKNDDKNVKALHGLVRSLVSNMVQGVSEGFERKLKINGTGYRAAVKGNTIDLTLGFSHPASYKLPDGVTAKMDGPTMIVLQSVDKQLIGQAAADIRAYRPPEPYQGKGVKYDEEVIRRKAGKAAGAK